MFSGNFICEWLPDGTFMWMEGSAVGRLEGSTIEAQERSASLLPDDIPLRQCAHGALEVQRHAAQAHAEVSLRDLNGGVCQVVEK